MIWRACSAKLNCRGLSPTSVNNKLLVVRISMRCKWIHRASLYSSSISFARCSHYVRSSTQYTLLRIVGQTGPGERRVQLFAAPPTFYIIILCFSIFSLGFLGWWRARPQHKVARPCVKRPLIRPRNCNDDTATSVAVRVGCCVRSAG